VNQPVVVGFDDSEHSVKAIEYAVREAIARQASVKVVHAFRWIPVPATPGVPLDEAPMEDVRHAITAQLDEAAQKIRETHPGLVVETLPVQGDPPRMLADAARDAAMLVVGGRGSGGFTGLLLGSVALRTLSMAECPVMAVRGDHVPRTGRIMVGVDLLAPAQSTDALEFAFTEAVLHKAEVSAIHVWEDPSRMYGIGGRRSGDVFTAFEDSQREHLAAVLEPWEQKYPGVPVTRQTFPGSPSRMLVDSTRLVDTLVIGGRDRVGGHTGMRIGALAHTILHHAHCPVIVVPERSPNA
jgi:nucleotide-binding universal stress UspA family protein